MGLNQTSFIFLVRALIVVDINKFYTEKNQFQKNKLKDE